MGVFILQWSLPFPPKEKVDALKHDYDYFYPFDIRSSAKDLVPNHLTMALYNHVVVLPEQKWPLSMRTNGHLMLNGEKMSKSKGNFLTLRQAVDKFGDGLEDADFDEKTANANMLRVAHAGWIARGDMVKDKDKLRHGGRICHDEIFENEVNELINITQSHYEACVKSYSH
ncbi:hypothetical protein M378DRAFT_10765 [Amanita muscaria Koide BX008]|uniref:Uncharacterized protein n=1 Tax=Amanita muscaria (strain Koide BX008) TaxID=946122 RepID=A0A0C2WUB0_AMAMK|nr:hypothetical protein M378DRAFT_10765 [Amanita muscaria Koide BX008]